MGFYPQPNEWSCGPFALKHALAALGRVADEEDIARVARTHWWSGTDEIRLAAAARAYGCELPAVRRRRADRARRELVAYLRRRVPVLLCVDEWEHWITALRVDKTRFVVVDSNLDPVLNVLTWTQLVKRWRYHDVEYDEDDPPELFDLYPVKPRFRAPARADLSVKRVRFLRRADNQGLAAYWDEYLQDLLTICRPRSSQMRNPLSMAELLRRHQDLIVTRLVYWHGDIEPRIVRRLLSNLRFVAETYGLVIPSAARRRAVADVSILAALWAVAARGRVPMYELDEV